MLKRLFGLLGGKKGQTRRVLENAVRPVIEGMEDRTMFSFSAPVAYGVGSATSMKVADYNNDGKADIASLNTSNGSVNVLLGNGDGSFGATVSSPAGGTGSRMVSGDFNKDGNLDIVTCQGYSLNLELGNGDGSFRSGGIYYVGAYANDVDAGDVNHDGFDDLVTASFSYGGTTQLLLNDGHGGFLPTRNLAIGPTGQRIEVGDVNGDGNLDLVEQGGYYEQVLVGAGDGTFRSQPYLMLNYAAQDLQVADFNHDGMDDLLISGGGNVQLYAGNAAGTFANPTNVPVSGMTSLKAGDVNGDGNSDVVGNNGLVILGRGDGGFYVATQYGNANGSNVALGDLNGDGALDEVTGGSTGVNVGINANNDLQLIAGATQLSVSAPTNVTAGTPFDVTVSALDANGNIVTNFQGSVAIQGSAGSAPVYYTFTAADQGVHVIANAAKFFTAGSGTYSVMSPFLPTSTGTVNVLGAAAARFTVTAQASSVAGQSSTVTVSAIDAYGNSTSGYLGTLHLTSSDVQAGLPADYTFTTDDGGSHTFDVILKTAGNQTVSVSDSVNRSVNGTSTAVTVTPASAVSLSVVGGGGFIGSVNAVTITARDAFGNIDTGYNGIVHLQTSDPASTTSADAALINGTGVFTVTPMTLGAQTLSAVDVATGALVGTENINITPGWGTRYSATPLSNAAAGQTQTTTLTIYDSFGDVSTVFTGYVAVTSTDPRAPISYVYFSAADQGVKTIPVTLYTAGVQAVTLSDYLNPGVTTTQTGITITPGAASSISVTPVSSGVAGTAQNITVSARDQYGNIATSYRGTLSFASSDTLASLPANYTFTDADNGTHTFTIAMKSSGGQDITITDTANPLMSYYQRDIQVSAASLAGFSFKAASLSNTTAGAVVPVTVSAVDAFGNAISNYLGTVHFTSTDAQAGLPTDYTFTWADAGAHVFNITLKTAGSQSVTASDGAVSGSVSTTVKAAAASGIGITTSGSAMAGTPQNVTVFAIDAYGNLTSGYNGTIKFSSSDAIAGLPANYTFTNKDGGSHTFSVTFRTAGSQSITATDTLNAAITATQSGITVTPSVATVTSFAVTGLTAATAGQAGRFTVTARDASGNVVTGYTGTVVFSSSDVKAGLPASYAFTSADAGSHSFNATLFTAGTQSISVADSTNSTAVGTQSGIVVSPGAAAQFVFSTPTSVKQGSGFKFTVTVLDAYGNIATNYRGKVTLTSTDAKGGSSSYTFSSGDAGVHTFSYTFNTLGTQTLKLQDSANAALLGTANVSVLAK